MGAVNEWVKILLPTLPAFLVVVFGWLLLGRLEEIKSEVVRYSDFNRKWAELLFDAANTYMISFERVLTNACLLSAMPNPNDEFGMKQQQQINDLILIVAENRFRIQRLVGLAPLNGPAASKAADKVFESVLGFTQTKTANVEDLRGLIDEFNRAAREAHSEMLASRRPH